MESGRKEGLWRSAIHCHCCHRASQYCARKGTNTTSSITQETAEPMSNISYTGNPGRFELQIDIKTTTTNKITGTILQTTNLLMLLLLLAISPCYPSSLALAHCRAVYKLPRWRIRKIPTYFSIKQVVDTVMRIVFAYLELLELDLEP